MKTLAVSAASFGILFVGVPELATGSARPQRSLQAMLLNVQQMPTGWGVNNSAGSGIGCLHNLLEPGGIRQTGSAGVSFADNGSLPAFVEKLATYAAPAPQAFAKIVTTLNACKKVSGTQGGQKATATVGAMSFPRFGDQSAAWVVSLSTAGITATEDVLVVRKGAVVAGFANADLSAPNLGQFQGFVRKALAKIG